MLKRSRRTVAGSSTPPKEEARKGRPKHLARGARHVLDSFLPRGWPPRRTILANNIDHASLADKGTARFLVRSGSKKKKDSNQNRTGGHPVASQYGCLTKHEQPVDGGQANAARHRPWGGPHRQCGTQPTRIRLVGLDSVGNSQEGTRPPKMSQLLNDN